MKRETMNGELTKKTAVGAAASLLIFFAALALLSLAAVDGKIQEAQIGTLSWLLAFASTFAGVKLIPVGDDATAGALRAGSFASSLLLLGFLINGELNAGRAAALLLAVLLGWTAAYLTRGKGRKKKKRSRK